MSKPLTASLACVAALLATVAGGVRAAPEEVTYCCLRRPTCPPRALG